MFKQMKTIKTIRLSNSMSQSKPNKKLNPINQIRLTNRNKPPNKQ